jgi:hypothetical protein
MEEITMNTTDNISTRGLKLASVLEKPHGHLKLILGYIDLENEVEELRKKQVANEDLWPTIEFNNICQIELDSDDEGFLRKQFDEKTFIESLSALTGFDIRIICSPIPKELGLYMVKIVYKQGDNALQGTIRLWVLPIIKT